MHYYLVAQLETYSHKLKIVIGFVVFMLWQSATPVFADYVIAVTHLKNGEKTVLTSIMYYNSMDDCKEGVEGLLSRAGKHTGGSWYIAETDDEELVRKAYFFHDEAGVNCVVIPSNQYGSE